MLVLKQLSSAILLTINPSQVLGYPPRRFENLFRKSTNFRPTWNSDIQMPFKIFEFRPNFLLVILKFKTLKC